MHTEKRAEERSTVIKKQSDILLVNKGVDLSDQKELIAPIKKKLKLILPSKKKIRNVSNDSNDGNGPKLKIKTNRKVTDMKLLKKEEGNKNATIVPKKENPV